ncbi:MAG TPA: hypothetical protein VMI56_21620 [Reyranella sp.]|nr:hypothetical protein [Reyranella sp.]
MKNHRQPDFPPWALQTLLLIVLSGAVGGLYRGFQGGLWGVIAGIALSVVPTVVRRGIGWTARPGGVVGLLAGQTARAAIAGGQKIVDALGGPTRAIGSFLRRPLFVARFLGYAAANVITDRLAAMARSVATLLGVANLCAVIVLVADLAGVKAAAIAVFAGLPMMIVVLLVSLSEREAEHG